MSIGVGLEVGVPSSWIDAFFKISYDMEKECSEYGKERAKDIGNGASLFASYDASSYDMENDGSTLG